MKKIERLTTEQEVLLIECLGGCIVPNAAQVGDSCGHYELEASHGAAKIATLADPKATQSCQGVFNNEPGAQFGSAIRSRLELTGDLDQPFLCLNLDCAPLRRAGATGSKWAVRAALAEVEDNAVVGSQIRSLGSMARGAGHLRQFEALARRGQLDIEGALWECIASSLGWNFGQEFAFGVGKLLAVGSAAVGAVSKG